MSKDLNTSDNLKRRKQIARLILAHDVVTNALKAVILLHRTQRHEHNSLSEAFHNSMIINYGAAFNEADPLGAISSKWSKFDNKHHQEIHNTLCQLRNQSVAHGNYDFKNIHIEKFIHDDESSLSKARYVFSVSNHTVSSVLYEDIIEMLSDLKTRMKIKISEQLYAVYGNSATSTDEFLLLDPNELITEERI